MRIATCACTSAAAPAHRRNRKPLANRCSRCAWRLCVRKSFCPRARRWAITFLEVLLSTSRDLTVCSARGALQPTRLQDCWTFQLWKDGVLARRNRLCRRSRIRGVQPMLTIHSVAGRAFATAILACAAMATFAQVADQPGANLPTIVVTAQHLNEERSRIDTQTGASTYTFNSKDIQSAPGGDNVQLNQVMLQVPDAAQDSFGQLHIRGDHNGLQFRLNGVILPDGISVFGQTLPPRMIASMKLITGSLPAEYGLRSAGIIDLTTKGGALQPGGDVSVYGGSHAAIEPSVNYGGTSGSNTYFVTGDMIRNDLGIESPDGRSTPLHDHTRQYHGFGYFEHIFDESNRLSVLGRSSDDRFETPSRAGANGRQSGRAYQLSGARPLRAGAYAQTDRLTSNTASQRLPRDATAAQTSDVPLGIIADTRNTQWIESAYLQDEWHRAPVLV